MERSSAQRLQIRDLHKEYITEHCDTRDVMIVAHGHFNRVLIARWLGLPLSQGMLSVALNAFDGRTHFAQAPCSTLNPAQ